MEGAIALVMIQIKKVLILLKIRIPDDWSRKFYKKSKYYFPLCSDGGTDHFPAVLILYFSNLEALLLVLPLFTPGQGARSMSLHETYPPVHHLSNLKAKQRRGERA
jgi:hypothetical protein